MRVKFVFDEARYPKQTIEDGLQELAEGLSASGKSTTRAA